MERYNHKEIEKKWRDKWNKDKVAEINKDDKSKDKYYVLDMFPYPSGEGIHMGHTENYTASDVFYRFKKMKGFNVLHPQGFDSFGLPAENYAIKTGIHPAKTTEENINTYIDQMKSLGLNYDFNEKVITSKPEYYKWTQWIFGAFYKNDLVYKKTTKTNWCSSCQTVIANEQVVNGECERCSTEIVQKETPSWFFKITDFADDLINDLDKVDWPEHTKKNQKNWIGKSEGAKIKFDIFDKDFRKKEFIFLHGHDQTSGDFFFPELEKVIIKKGGKVVFKPNLPNSRNPSLEEQEKYILDKYKFNENTVIIAHSLGSVLAMKLISRASQRINKLVLISTGTGPEGLLDEDKKNILKNYCDWKFDFNKIKSLVGEIVIMADINDHIIPIEQPKEIAENLGVKLLITKSNKPHFTAEKEEFIEDNIFDSIEVFTTRPDTLFGATYMVLAPDHSLVMKMKGNISNWSEVEKYIIQTQKKTEMERVENKEKSGVKLEGISAINPANNEDIPIFIADYVLSGYGTGAIMAVPAHDERDFEFAKKYNIDIKYVISPRRIDKTNPPIEGKKTVSRETVHVLLVNPKENKVACLHSKEHPWVNFIVGGVEKGEDKLEAARREVYEETGYKNIKFVKYLNSVPVIAEYYAAHKDHNKKVSVTGLVFELENEERDEISEEEKAKHDIVWYSYDRKTLEENINPCTELDIWMSGLDSDNHCYPEKGILTNSNKFNGLSSEEAGEKITEVVGGKMTTTYRLRDWSISRQRYWGCPIPIVYSPEGETKLVPEEHLPWTLPTDVDFKPTGVSPLSESKELKERTEKIFGKGWIPEYDTMDTFVDSSWYFLRYPDTKNTERFAGKERLKHWMPVDLYIGGAEHTYMHLLFARFFVKALKKIGLVDFDEPFLKLKHQGMVMAPDGRKMSKSLGNVVNPNEMIERFGADSVRTYVLFLGPLEDMVIWNEDNIVGVYRFLEKVWDQSNHLAETTSDEVKNILHKTIKKVGNDIEELKYNTAISEMMKLMNATKQGTLDRDDYSKILKILAPFAPYIAEELWNKMGNSWSIHDETWPKYDENLIKDATHMIAVQVMGKVRAEIKINDGASEDEVKKIALTNETVKKWLGDNDLKKVIYVKNKILNIVI